MKYYKVRHNDIGKVEGKNGAQSRNHRVLRCFMNVFVFQAHIFLFHFDFGCSDRHDDDKKKNDDDYVHLVTYIELFICNV